MAFVKSRSSSAAVWNDHEDHEDFYGDDCHDEYDDNGDDDDTGWVWKKKLTMIRYADCIFLWYFCTDHVAPGNFCQY